MIQQIYPGNQVFELLTNIFSGIVCHKILWVTISGKSSQERASLLLYLAYFKRAFSASIQIFLAALVKPSRLKFIRDLLFSPDYSLAFVVLLIQA